MKYLVSYDISNPKDLDAVYTKLDNDEDAKPVLKSQWILDKQDTDVQKICDDLVSITSGQDVMILVNTWDCSDAFYTELLCKKEDIALDDPPPPSLTKRLFASIR